MRSANLRLAAGGQEEHLAFEDQVCIMDSRIRVRDARPVGRVAKMGPGDVGEGIAFLNDDSCGRAETRGYCGQENLGACHDVVGVNDGRIDSEQIVPAKPLAEVFLGKLPE